jgi:hypothetical protein
MTAAKCMGSHQEIIAISMIPLDKARLFLSRTVGSCLENPFRRSDLELTVPLQLELANSKSGGTANILLFYFAGCLNIRLDWARRHFPVLIRIVPKYSKVPFISGKPVHAFHGIIRHVELQSMFNCRMLQEIM